MKSLLKILPFYFLFAITAAGQTQLDEGEISFMSSKKVYVKFASTEGINTGDTLFVNKAGQLIPVVLVENKSSSSVVGNPLDGVRLNVGDKLSAKTVKKTKKKKEKGKAEPFPDEKITADGPPRVIPPQEEDPAEEVLFKEKIKGRISAASYSNISDYRTTHRMRYAFSFRGYNLKNSRFSVENYVTFRHTLKDSISLADALKVYSLAVKYDIDKNTHVTFGRKINPRFSSVGAIDGLQFEKGFGKFQVGAIAGTRPNFRDYSFDFNLLQFGAYVGFKNEKNMQSTFGVIEQMNKGKTDRRFVYLQHSGSLMKGLHLFSSMEVDLYENINNEAKNITQLTNFYVSLRYRLNRKWRVSAAYDNRKNIIYYESYKSFIDQLIEDETRQGFRVGISHRPFRNLSWGVNGNMRFQKSGGNKSRNIGAYVTMNKVPFINARASLRANLLQTSFIDSRNYSFRLNKEIVRGKVNAEAYFRWVDYHYLLGDRVVHQNIVGASVSVRVQKSLSLFLFYEGVLENTKQNYHRFNAKLVKRF